MQLEIISPEAILLQSEVKSVAVPGVNGEFQMLDNHAPIVSLLQKGKVIIDGDLKIEEDFQDKFQQENGKTILQIHSGTVEMSNNKVIILVD
jgi:F-type H+-transporting ATPase subunit epsilon